MSRSLGGTSLTTRSPIEDVAVGDLLQAGEHAQAGGLAAARRADEDEELLVGDLDVEVVDGDDIAEALVDVFEGDTGHWVICSL